MLGLYSSIMGASTFFLKNLLQRRCRKGKEDPERLGERMGVPGLPRPEGRLAWFHAASVGEAQSTLILINTLLKQDPALHVLVTTGTVTSAGLMIKRLPRQAVHQYYPLDHPQWVKQFLDHWQPDLVLWMESEIWPNMILEIKKRHIPAALVNARLSPASFKRWKLAVKDINTLLGTFQLCLTQTEEDANYFRQLGAANVVTTDNLKYSADPLPGDEAEEKKIIAAIGQRPVWLYASTHDGEEDMAARIHTHLKKSTPDLLTIIVPRHPERREEVRRACERHGLKTSLRSQSKKPPSEDDEIYIADTMGELGIFYRASPIACIGRTFSNDGGGGHNPIEAAQLNCAILHGPKTQNLAQIFEEFDRAGAALPLKDEKDFQNRLEKLLADSGGLEALQNKAHLYVTNKGRVLAKVMEALAPLLHQTDENQKKKICA